MLGIGSALTRRGGMRLLRGTTCFAGITTATTNSPRRFFSFKFPFSSFSEKSSSASSSASAASGSDGSALPAASYTKEQRRLSVKAQQEATLLNERLVDACLQVLELCGGSATGSAPRLQLDGTSQELLWDLSDIMLHDFRRSPCEQFDLIYAALCLPTTLEDRQLQRSLMVMLESVVPLPVFRLFESNNLIVETDDEQSLHQRDVLRVFTHAMLGSLRAPADLHEEEVLLVYIDDFKHAFPQAAVSPVFVSLEQDAATIAMKAKLYTLLRQLCAEFDKENTGKVRLAELQETADRVLGKEQAAMLLRGASADAEGMIAYPQLTAMLTRPPPEEATQKGKSPQ